MLVVWDAVSNDVAQLLETQLRFHKKGHFNDSSRVVPVHVLSQPLSVSRWKWVDDDAYVVGKNHIYRIKTKKKGNRVEECCKRSEHTQIKRVPMTE